LYQSRTPECGGTARSSTQSHIPSPPTNHHFSPHCSAEGKRQLLISPHSNTTIGRVNQALLLRHCCIGHSSPIPHPRVRRHRSQQHAIAHSITSNKSPLFTSVQYRFKAPAPHLSTLKHPDWASESSPPSQTLSHRPLLADPAHQSAAATLAAARNRTFHHLQQITTFRLIAV